MPRGAGSNIRFAQRDITAAQRQRAGIEGRDSSVVDVPRYDIAALLEHNFVPRKAERAGLRHSRLSVAGIAAIFSGRDRLLNSWRAHGWKQCGVKRIDILSRCRA